MKVYFEPHGWGGDGKGHHIVTLSIYVDPQSDGSAYYYNALGGKVRFWWADTRKAAEFDSEQLPKRLWQSIQYGLHFAEMIEEDYRANGVVISLLKYTKVNMKEIDAWKEVKARIGSVHSIEDFKELYPTIKKSDRLDMEVITTLFNLVGEQTIPEVNGELGIYFMQNQLKFLRIISQLGWE